MDDGSALRTTLRTWRHEAGMSLRELGAAAGLDYTYLSKIESGKAGPPSTRKLLDLARALGRSDEEAWDLVRRAQEVQLSMGEIRAILRRYPEVAALLRRLKERPLSPHEVKVIRTLLD
ncbi:MAG TPA: helix-turn-helix transcriptional regulator [Chloroflexota bacterium]|nr:helix-turn-helix transcriptional regulator [Chloroflexota bacterium]